MRVIIISMHLQKIINKQTAKAGQLPILLQRSETPSNFQSTGRNIKKKQLTEERMLAEDSQNKSSHECFTPWASQRLLVQSSSEIEGRQQSHLTPQQRKVVGDISRLFGSEASKPTKLLIRLNQTQSGRAGRGGEGGNPAGSRLQKIEITRLNEQGKVNITDFVKPATDLTTTEELPSKIKQNHPEEGSPVSSIDIIHSKQSIDSHRGGLAVFKQISIMYVPDLNMSTLIGMKNPPQLFSKFTKRVNDKCLESVGSNFSQDFIEKKEEPSSPFVKLLQIDLFVKRSTVQQHRSQELRMANEKMLALHLMDKESIEQYRKHIEKIEQSFNRKMEELAKQLQDQREINSKMVMDIQAKEKSMANSQKLHEQYLKENNELKSKIKEYIKTIHELKAEITNKNKIKIDENMNTNITQALTDRKTVSPKLCFEQRNSNEYGVQDHLPKSPRKQVTFNEAYREPAVNSKFYEGNPYYQTQRNEKMAYNYSKIEAQGNQPKLNNCRSQGIIARPEPNSNDKDERKQKVEPASRSQKGVGIRRNNLNQQPISPSTRNLVRVNKNINNDGSILIGDKLRDNKSLSSYSNLSGKSLSQRIGFVSKLNQVDKSKGMLVDYMIDAPIPERGQQKVKDTSEKFKFRRGPQ